jgi:hypothetical protein
VAWGSGAHAMRTNEYIVSIFALLILLFFCSPIFALAIGIWSGVAPSSLGLKLFVGLTNTQVVNSVHSLMLPLVGAVVIFRSDYFSGIVGTILLLVMCTSIILGFLVYVLLNPLIFGEDQLLRFYMDEYKDVHNSIFDMISMIIILFLAKLGVNGAAAETGEPADKNAAKATDNDTAEQNIRSEATAAGG